MKVIQTTVYEFDELSDSAKDKARDWFRQGDEHFWAEAVIEDAERIANLMGIDFDRREFKTVGGTTRTEPDQASRRRATVHRSTAAIATRRVA